MPNDELCFLPATVLAARIRVRELSALEVMEAHLARIARVNPAVNAIVTLVADQALAGAAAADEALARGIPVGPLHGLPVAHKDLEDTAGIRTTRGSPIFANHVPEADSLVVRRLKVAGAVTVGKTNTPEFGAGSQTFNEVFGTTLNPYDLTKTCGGSSGGAAVALACGMVPIADGSDTGGSLRNPAGYCNVVGFRPSPGRVPSEGTLGWQTLSVHGPLARSVEDVALMMSAIAGPHAGSPVSIDEPGRVFAQTLDRDFRGIRIAWSPSLGGLPVDPRTAAVFASSLRAFEALGCEAEDADPDMTGADEAFYVARAYGMAARHAELMKTHRDLFKEEIVWNVEEGLKLSALDVARAEEARTRLFRSFGRFMERYEYLVLPVSQVPPFPITERFVSEINSVPMANYIDWMKSCWQISITGHPAISVPGGFTIDGLPVGVQIVGRHRADFGVLQLAHAFEGATGHGKVRPAVAG